MLPSQVVSASLYGRGNYDSGVYSESQTTEGADGSSNGSTDTASSSSQTYGTSTSSGDDESSSQKNKSNPDEVIDEYGNTSYESFGFTKKDQKELLNWQLIVGFCCLLLALAVILIVLKKRRNKNKQNGQEFTTFN